MPKPAHFHKMLTSYGLPASYAVWEPVPTDQISSLRGDADFKWRFGLYGEQERLGVDTKDGRGNDVDNYELQRRVIIARADEAVHKSCDEFIQSELGANQ